MFFALSDDSLHTHEDWWRPMALPDLAKLFLNPADKKMLVFTWVRLSVARCLMIKSQEDTA